MLSDGQRLQPNLGGFLIEGRGPIVSPYNHMDIPTPGTAPLPSITVIKQATATPHNATSSHIYLPPEHVAGGDTAMAVVLKVN